MQYVKDPDQQRESYMYTYFIQINLSSVDGIRLVSSSNDDIEQVDVNIPEIVLNEEDDQKEDWMLIENSDEQRPKPILK